MREGYNNLHIVTVDGLDRIYEDGGILYEDGVITHVGDRAYIEKKAGELKIELKDGKEGICSRDLSTPTPTCIRIS